MKGPGIQPGPFVAMENSSEDDNGKEPLTQMHILIAGSIDGYGGIEDFTAGDTFPGIKRANEVVEFVRVHSAFALGAFHSFNPPLF